MAANRERRSNAGHRNVAQNTLEQLKAARSGDSRANQLQLVDDGDIYRELSEADWALYVARRKEVDSSFVEDDVGGMDDDDYWDDAENADKERAISRVNRQQRNGRVGSGIAANDHVSSVLLGGGQRQVGPGSYGNLGAPMTEDQLDQLKAFTQELGDGDEATEEDDRRRRQRLLHTTMFGQESMLQDGLNQIMEEQLQEDGSIIQVAKRTLGGMDPSALNRALFAGSSAVKLKPALAKSLAANSQFNKILPRLTLDEDGNLIDGDGDLDGDLVGDSYMSNDSFGIGDNMPDASDATFAKTEAKRPVSKGVNAPLPPAIKQISFANGESGADWFKVSAAGVPQMKLERGNVILSRPSEKMDGISPAYTVKLERTAPVAPDAAADAAPVVTSHSFDEITMFWFDACEQDGSIYLFGKALLPDKKSTTSCCVRILNMDRNLFVLPRAFKVQDPDDELGTVTDEAVNPLALHSEVKKLLHEQGIKKFKSKMVTRDYCFDREVTDLEDLQKHGGKTSLLDGDDGVPRKTQYLKVLYPFTSPSLERNAKGETFSRIFGTKSTALELFLLKRQIMGPCWLTIRNIEAPPKPHSWAKFNFTISSQKHINVLADHPDSPLFSVMSISMKTVLNEATQRHEIVMASYMSHEGVSVEGPTANETDISHCTIVSKLPANQLAKTGPGATTGDVTIIPIPPEFELKVKHINAEATKKGGKNKIEAAPNERALLSLLMAKIHSLDPDVIVGHDLHGFTVDVLLNRMNKNTLGLNWSKLGRMIKSKMPQSNGRGDDSFSLVDRGVGVGRLMLDTKVSAQEFMIGQKNYTLSYLAETQLKVRHEEIESRMVPHAYKKLDTLLELVKHNENDAFLQLSLMHKVVMLPLSKQLTNLCGNTWARSLRAARAERVEFLLMHDFHRSKFLIPEKYTKRERDERNEARDEKEKLKLGPNPTPDQLKALRASKNKPQYAGGLVLEPKRGFYDKYVLLLDFNSLYPSIIQEFNVCFTTVKHWHVAQGDLAPVPAVGSEDGHLPRVIKRLVQRRRAVKDMLKRETNKAKMQELDIRQKALKLVANSMYGCLGFVGSRFYCEPLAALVTSQGREILQSSVELTNTLDANVIYGDTDSIMVYSNETDLGKAMDLGRKIRAEINKRHKVLEIDIDGVFKNMLLLRKKKYAALKIVEQPGGGLISQREVKGLDLVRRDWCPLSKDIGLAVLGEILSGAPREEVVEKIHAHLMKLRDDIKNNQISLDKFIITKGLTKNPKEYADGKTQPHVKVALDIIAQGGKCKSGDFVPYVICKKNSDDGPEDKDKKNAADRAFDPAHVVRAMGALELDMQWYLEHQILPPVVRLIGPIEETDAARVAFALGLDPKNHHHTKLERPDDDDDESMGISTQDDEEKYKTAVPLMVTCAHCKESYQFPGVYHKLDVTDKPMFKRETISADGNVVIKEEIAEGAGVPVEVKMNLQGPGQLPLLSGLKCPNSITKGCPGLLDSVQDTSRTITHFVNRINSVIRKQTQAYYGSYFKCNDSSCNRRTRDLCVKGNACLAITTENFKEFPCKGRMEREIPASQLYLQLQYLRSLFDWERAAELVTAENARRKLDTHNKPPQLQATSGGNGIHNHIYKHMHSHMISVLQQSRYYWLPPSIFDTKIAATNNKRR